MAIAVVLDIPGGTLAQYDQVLAKMELTPGGQTPPGALFHWAAATDGGILVTDVWETREQFDAYAEAKIGPFSAEFGLPDPVMTFYDVHAHLAAR